MIKSSVRNVILLTVCLSAAVLVLSGPAATPAGAEDGIPKKLKRQIGVMEKVLDEVLVESPNLLVQFTENTRGIYLEEFGVLFVLEASLVHSEHRQFWMKGMKIERRDGNVIVITGDDDEDDEDDEERDEDEEETTNWEESEESNQRERYEAGKAELVEALVDYGETITGLDGNQWVGVAAFMRDSDYFMSKKISRLVVKAQMRDLRDHSAGRLSREAMEKKVVIEEY